MLDEALIAAGFAFVIAVLPTPVGVSGAVFLVPASRAELSAAGGLIIRA